VASGGAELTFVATIGVDGGLKGGGGRGGDGGGGVNSSMARPPARFAAVGGVRNTRRRSDIVAFVAGPWLSSSFWPYAMPCISSTLSSTRALWTGFRRIASESCLSGGVGCWGSSPIARSNDVRGSKVRRSMHENPPASHSGGVECWSSAVARRLKCHAGSSAAEISCFTLRRGRLPPRTSCDDGSNTGVARQVELATPGRVL